VQFNYSRSGRNGIWLRVLQVQYARKDVGVGVGVGYCDDPTAMQAGFVPMLVVGSLGCSRCKRRCGCVLTVWYRNGSSFGTRGSAVSGGGRRGGAGQDSSAAKGKVKVKVKEGQRWAATTDHHHQQQAGQFSQQASSLGYAAARLSCARQPAAAPARGSPPREGRSGAERGF
jgi:hypothetical protein